MQGAFPRGVDTSENKLNQKFSPRLFIPAVGEGVRVEGANCLLLWTLFYLFGIGKVPLLLTDSL